MTELALTTQPASAIARSTIAHHSKSFALASALLGARVRDETAVVYTWCRRVDDAIDTPGDPDPVATLVALHADLDAVYAGETREPVLAAFARVVHDRRIPRSYPDELLAGMAMDASGMRYETLDDLLRYCWRVAGVVGLMMSHVFGVADDRALIRAAHLGIGMQLTNICRDVAEDWGRGRLYLPDEMLAAQGVRSLDPRPDQPFPAEAVPAVAAVVRDLLALADRYYRSGDRGVGALPWRAALAVRAARGVYSAIGDRVAATGFDVTAGRAVAPRHRKFVEVVRAVGRVTLSVPSRAVRFAFGRRIHVPTTELELLDVARP